jgi:hypothetical protein
MSVQCETTGKRAVGAVVGLKCKDPERESLTVPRQR